MSLQTAQHGGAAAEVRPENEIGAPRNRPLGALDDYMVSKWRTKCLATECVRMIIGEAAGTSRHFDPLYAQDHPDSECLVTRMADLIGVAANAADSKNHLQQLAGLRLMQDVITRFSQVGAACFRALLFAGVFTGRRR
jgi:hypothetical protein